MKDIIINSLSKIVNLNKQEISNLIETPKDSALGDLAFPCFALAKQLKKNPTEIAQELASKIKSPDFEKITAVGPYINFFINRDSLAAQTLKEIEKQKDKYGSSNQGKEKIMIEFSQANTHKAFHVGHVRGTSLGESISRILEFTGNKVTRANYQGDTGMHVAKWIWCFSKYHKKEIKKDESWIAGIYVDAVKRLAENPDLQEEVDEINRNLESKNKSLNETWEKTRKLSLDSLEPIYKDLDTRFDIYFFESEVEKRGKEISEELVNKKIAEISEGATIINLEKYNLGVWVLLRKDGTVLYSAKDLALSEKKFKEFKIDKAIYVVGSEQRLHLQQLFKTLELMNFKQAKNCAYIPVSEVRFPWGKMSSRTGENILYSNFRQELIDYAVEEIKKRHKINEKEAQARALAIAIASMKYSMLKQDVNKIFVFDKEEALRFEGDTGPYLLYTYARAKSILRKAKARGKLKISNLNEQEKQLILQLSQFPEIVLHAYKNLSPNIIANYAFQLAQTFNEFYHSNKVIGSEQESFRLALVSSTSQVLKNALSLLGIQVLEKM